jgi:hypothetical protein
MSTGTVEVAGRGDSSLGALIAEFQSEAFVKAPAVEKRDRLWEALSAQPYESLPPVRLSGLTSLFRLLKLGVLRQAFEVDADVRPPREKSFHPFGTVAKVRFVADGRHEFTGLFESGAVGLARLSLALSERAYAPSSAFKFFIDGRPSRNLLLDQSVDQQTSRDFFERVPTNITLWPTLFPRKYVWLFVNALLSTIAPVMEQPLDHIASITSEGQDVAQFTAPYQVYMVAPGEIHQRPSTTVDFRTLLSRIPTGSVLFKVFANRSAADTEMIYVGSIVTESPFVASEFGDRVLSLRHFRREKAGES